MLKIKLIVLVLYLKTVLTEVIESSLKKAVAVGWQSKSNVCYLNQLKDLIGVCRSLVLLF